MIYVYLETIWEAWSVAREFGFETAVAIVSDCFLRRKEIKAVVEKWLGLQVEKICWLSKKEKKIIMQVRRPKRKQSRTSTSEREEGDEQTTMKRRKILKNEGSGASSGGFAAALSAKSAEQVADMDAYLEKVKEECIKEAEKGFTTAMVIVNDCLANCEEMRVEVEMLGLQVDQVRWITSDKKDIVMKVRWPDAKSAVSRDPGQLSGLEKGNLRGECKVCFQEETMCRLHPCGHIFGQDCAKKWLGKPCPFCRKVVRLVHPIYEP